MINVTISYDYELFWGMHNNLKATHLQSAVVNANSAASALFGLHEELIFPCTWAVVGIAADDECRDIEYEYFLKHYKGNINGAARVLFDECVGRSELSSISALFRRLKLSNLQEIGSHTYYHTFFDQHEPDSEEARHDFERFGVLAERERIFPVSFVCPKNIFSRGLIPVLEKHGFSVVRVNPDNLLYNGGSPQKVSFLNRVCRIVDFFLPINETLNAFTYRGKDVGEKNSSSNLKFTIATLFFRGSSGFWILDQLALIRFKLHCRLSIALEKDIHMWTHPHNFGLRKDLSLRFYTLYLNYIKKLEGDGHVFIKSMKDL
jgi:hypothetical protein